MTDWTLTRSYYSPAGRIRWDVFGTGAPVVLLHGTPNWSFIWRKVVGYLAERYRVYVFDWPGFGMSDRFEGQNISWDEQPRRLVELISHWELKAPAIVAFDFAPIFALRAHFLEGLQLGPMVLADAAVIPPFVTNFSRQAREDVGVFSRLPTHIAEAMIGAHIAKTTWHSMPTHVFDGYMLPWRGPEGVAAYWRAVNCYDEHMARPLVERLGSLASPTLVIWGEHDAWLPPSMGEDLAARIPDGRLQFIANAGHFAPEDNPAEFAEAITAFLAEVGH